jgi:hypothetical protein
VGGGQMSATIGGNTPMTFVTGIQSITVVNGGSEYYTDTPSVYFVPPLTADPSTVATATLTVNGGNISGVNITNGGQGYQPIPATMSVASATGIDAVLVPLVNAAGEIAGVEILSAGSNYSISDTVTATRAVAPNPAYVNATFAITSIGNLGQILEVAVIRPGTGYQNSVTEIKIVSTLDNTVEYPTGVGFYGLVLTDESGAITGVSVFNSGSGYQPIKPFVVITDPGTGSVTDVTLTGTSVQSISIVSPGSGYTPDATASVFNPATAPAPNPPTVPAVLVVNTAVNTFNTDPNMYYQVWTGTATNRPLELQLNQVISYFTALGYSIRLETNPQTGSTLQWNIYW